ncbi:MAG: hypothetical protein MHPSP_003921, partial [Paramarteilia canceri]
MTTDDSRNAEQMMFFKVQLEEVFKQLKENPDDESLIDLKLHLIEGINLVVELQKSHLLTTSTQWSSDEICLIQNIDKKFKLGLILDVDNLSQTCKIKILTSQMDSEATKIVSFEQMRK